MDPEQLTEELWRRIRNGDNIFDLMEIIRKTKENK
jgi:hypothetical protein